MTVAVVLALGLAACRGEPVTDPTPSVPPTTASPSPTTSPTTPGGDDTPAPTRTVEVHFANDRLGDPCEDTFPVARTVSAVAPLRGALEALLAGPTDDERARGYGGWFGPATEGLLVGVRVEGARALVSFHTSLPDRIPNASSSCGSTALLTALDATATQFPEVDEAWYDLEGDRAAFYGWLQYAAPDDRPVAPLPTPSPTPTPTPAPTPTAAPTPVDATEWTTLPASAGQVVALTFDAGANGDAVPAILDTLAATGTPATFFLTGRWVIAYPQLAAAVGARHAVGNHSMTHPDLTTLSDDAVRDELRGAADTITANAGDDPRPWFRFPYGARDARTLGVVGDDGWRAVRWTVDTRGWLGTSGGVTADAVVDAVLGALRPGAVVLMHVGSNPTDGSTLDADALAEVITGVRAAGYTLVDLDAIPPD